MDSYVYLKDRAGNNLGTSTNPLVIYATGGATSTTTHNSLASLQGGLATDEYYHLNATSFASVIAWDVGGGGSGAYASIAGYATACGTASSLLATATIAATKVILPVLSGTSIYANVNGWLDVIQSGGRISGGVLSESATGGKLDVSAIEVFIKTQDSNIGETKLFTVPATAALTLTQNNINYIYVDYNGGTPIIRATTDRTTIKQTNQFTLGRCFRELSDNVEIMQSGINLFNRTRKVHERWIDTFGGLSYANGIIPSCTGLKPAITAGTLYAGSNKLTIPATDCNTGGTFSAFYWNTTGATWVETTGQTTLGNTQYNNTTSGTGLATLSGGRYAVHWLYVCPEGNIYTLWGQGDYTLTNAQNLTAPEIVPNYLSQWAKLAAKILIQKSASSVYSITIAWTTQFPVQSAGDHNNLAGLQGGGTDDYYHSMATEYTGTGTGIFVRQYSPLIYAGMGINTAAVANQPLTIKGNASTDLPTYSAEFLSATGWATTGWSGDWASGFTHATGNTTPITQSTAAVNAKKYQIAYTVSGTVGAGFTITFGGVTSPAITATGAWGPTSVTTGSLSITPATDFAGTIIISIKSITAVSTPFIKLSSSSDVALCGIRSGGSNSNVFIGELSGSYNTTGVSNTGLGSGSLQKNTTGNYNAAIGLQCLYTNTTGDRNSALGTSNLFSNITGSYNTTFGMECLYTNTTGSANIGIGHQALYFNVSGLRNIGIGYQSLLFTTSSYNAAIGYMSGFTLTGATYNSFLGYNAGYNANQLATAANSMGLGANTFTNRSNQIVIGDASVVETQLRTGVYIGSTSTTAHTAPTARLHIAAGTASASTAPIKLTSGTLMTNPESGALEFDGTDFWISI